ncbi:hypothetical protein JOD24_000449 [Kroppenstedtia sanguinis]|uniref:hypothetical protein n=1 Tax=Kroppenstedtia sanguinis TaxID=1380684 RepID=UPI003D237982
MVLISGIRKQPLEMLKKSGLYGKVDPEHFFPHTGMALRHGLTLINRQFLPPLCFP